MIEGFLDTVAIVSLGGMRYLGRAGAEMIRPLGLTIVDNALDSGWWNC